MLGHRARARQFTYGGARAPKVLLPTLDLWLNEDDPTGSAAASTLLNTSAAYDVRMTALLRFDLSSIAKPIKKVTLRMYSGSSLPVVLSQRHNIVILTEAAATWTVQATWALKTDKDYWPGDTLNGGGEFAGCTVAGLDYVNSALASMIFPINAPNGFTEAELTTSAVEAFRGTLLNLQPVPLNEGGSPWASSRQAGKEPRLMIWS